MARNRPQSPIKSDSTTQWFRLASGVVGAMLLGLAGLWLVWLLLHQFAGSAIPAPPIISAFPINPPVAQITPLVAEGITLGHPGQTPTLSQQQALLIASQLEPGAASKSKTPSAQYVLLNYPNKGTPATHPDFHDVPSWMILYQGIPLQRADASVDPTPIPRSSYDLYVFLDANSGKELLAIQV
jgi:hypothetical protein